MTPTPTISQPDTDEVKPRPIAKAAIVLAAIVGVFLSMVTMGWFIDRVVEIQESYRRPTADELYGCTIHNAAPNGECQ